MSGHKRGRWERGEVNAVCGTCIHIGVQETAFDVKYCILCAPVTCTAHVFLPCYRLHFISVSPLSISIISRNYSPLSLPHITPLSWGWELFYLLPLSSIKLRVLLRHLHLCCYTKKALKEAIKLSNELKKGFYQNDFCSPVLLCLALQCSILLFVQFNGLFE